MGLISDSRDLLNIVLAFCILWLTIFIAWFIYYLVMMMRRLYQMVKEMHDRINRVDEVIKALKDKIEHSASYLLLIGEGIKKLVEVIKDKTKDRGEKKKGKK